MDQKPTYGEIYIVENSVPGNFSDSTETMDVSKGFQPIPITSEMRFLRSIGNISVFYIVGFPKGRRHLLHRTCWIEEEYFKNLRLAFCSTK